MKLTQAFQTVYTQHEHVITIFLTGLLRNTRLDFGNVGIVVKLKVNQTTTS